MRMTMEEGKVRVFLDGELTVAEAAAVKDLLLEGLAAGDYVEVDLAGVTRMDLSTLQLICSAHRTARTSGKDLVLAGAESGLLLKIRKEAGYIRHQGCMYNPTKTCLWVGGTE